MLLLILLIIPSSFEHRLHIISAKLGSERPWRQLGLFTLQSVTLQLHLGPPCEGFLLRIRRGLGGLRCGSGAIMNLNRFVWDVRYLKNIVELPAITRPHAPATSGTCHYPYQGNRRSADYMRAGGASFDAVPA